MPLLHFKYQCASRVPQPSQPFINFLTHREKHLYIISPCFLPSVWYSGGKHVYFINLIFYLTRQVSGSWIWCNANTNRSLVAYLSSSPRTLSATWTIEESSLPLPLIGITTRGAVSRQRDSLE